MNTAAEEVLLESTLKHLKLPAVLREWRGCARQARETGERYESFLLSLMTREIEQRQNNQLVRRLRAARFPYLKTLEKTDLGKWPALDARRVREYSDGEYIGRRENLVILGRHGTGKTHAAIVFGIEACRQGHRVLFSTAADLVNTLVEAREDRQLKRYLARLAKHSLLIVDELGYIPFSKEGAELLFQVFANRYERGSLLVTSNLPFPEWTGVFGDASLTAALLDRLTHHCHILQFEWESIRLTESLKNRNRAREKGENRAVAATAAPAGL
ncbi:MAG: IS21-like element helper ATPase IstB [Acidobacteria bacterium]|nr:IS21-like element helper ATPase IstB [Acidobacteriota bacterium]